MYKKYCTICNKSFETIYKNKQVCSWECRQEKQRQRSRQVMRDRRRRVICQPCTVCGYKETTDIHHENGKTYVLCPNHHALITRGIKLFPEILKGKSAVEYYEKIFLKKS